MLLRIDNTDVWVGFLGRFNAYNLLTVYAAAIKLGFDKDEIAVFGDDVNDLEMISYYKHSVAMGNGDARVKEKASFVTRSNDEDGIAFALEILSEYR